MTNFATKIKDTESESAKLNGVKRKPNNIGFDSLIARAPLFGFPIQRKADCACGGGCPKCQESKEHIQPKLEIGHPSDEFEVEADRVAHELVHEKVTPSRPKETKVAKRIQTKISSLPGKTSKNTKTNALLPRSVNQTLTSAGQPLQSDTREFMERRFGQDFGRVRIHSDAPAAKSAGEINAKAYTAGNNIVFGEGQYQPATIEGKSLLAHELTHVVQQEASSASTVQRQLVTPLAAGGGLGGVMDRDRQQHSPPSPTAQDPQQSSQTVEPGVDLTQIPIESDEMVQRVVIACEDSTIAFVTGRGIYIYELTSCDVPHGTYQATVTTSGNNVTWTLGTHEGEGFDERARFRYRIRSGQENPATLFRRQRSVAVESVSHIQDVSQSPQERCQLMLRERELIAPRSFSRELFETLSFEREIWRQRIPLGQFGWVTFSVTAHGSASGNLSGGYGPGTLSNICLYQRMARGRIGGSAHFSFPAFLTATLNLTGGLDLAGHYLSVIPVGEIDGEINATAQASGQAAINSDLQVVYNPNPGAARTWEFSANNTLDVQGSLSFNANARIAVRFLTREIWSRDWNLVNAQIGASWRGGLIVRPDLSLEFNSGEFAVNRGGAASSLGATSGSGSGTPPSGNSTPPSNSGSSRLQQILDLATAVYDESRAQTAETPVLNVRVPPYSRYALGAPGTDIHRALLVQARDYRVNNTFVDFSSFHSNVGVMEITHNGQTRFLVDRSDPNDLHSELRLFRQLEAIDPNYLIPERRTTRVIQIYTERAPCGNCRQQLILSRDRLHDDFPVFYTVPYSGSNAQMARQLMEAYGLTPP